MPLRFPSSWLTTEPDVVELLSSKSIEQECSCLEEEKKAYVNDQSKDPKRRLVKTPSNWEGCQLRSGDPGGRGFDDGTGVCRRFRRFRRVQERGPGEEGACNRASSDLKVLAEDSFFVCHFTIESVAKLSPTCIYMSLMHLSAGLLDIVRNCTYIGMADDVYALLQHNTHLYLANIVNLSKELMYQQVLRRFAHFTAIQLSDPAPLPELIMLALKEEDLNPEGNEDDDLKEKIAEMNTELLKQKAEMLEEYFSIHVDLKGNLSRLPIILDQYTPDMDRVDWENEKNCFQSIAAALGNFYAISPPLLPNPSGDGLEFYKRTVPSISPEDADNPSLTKGRDIRLAS
ncbi:hypothetical protein RJ640_013411 [Escallonia rubra]|uniref:DNA mismatch repair protein Mlh1 C-terminal domain-containing protein n=1 Tax=Escallonia rubra TaxID=112253 RepID=A0AA88UDK8_9ASTE|nr:hypothetical protein RJ640_013411 [Escallonia rubra]